MSELGEFSSQSNQKEVPAGAPPPPSEVKVRTMRTDLETMAQSGGGLPRFQNVEVAALSPVVKKESGSKVLVVVIIIAIIVLLVVGYFVYRAFSGTTPGAATIPTSTATSTGTGIQPLTGSQPIATSTPVQPVSSGPTLAPELASAHASLFVQPADQVIAATFSINGGVSDASSLQSYSQKMKGFLASASSIVNFIEVDAKGPDGKDLSISGLFAAASVDPIDHAALQQDFSQDATFFVYRDKNGEWPGYVLSLLPGKNWLFVNTDIKGIETAGNLGNLFLTNAGVPSSGGFIDSTISSSSVRILPFTGAPPAIFVYGWYKTYLVISTSQNGFADAVAHLQAAH